MKDVVTTGKISRPIFDNTIRSSEHTVLWALCLRGTPTIFCYPMDHFPWVPCLLAVPLARALIISVCLGFLIQENTFCWVVGEHVFKLGGRHRQISMSLVSRVSSRPAWNPVSEKQNKNKIKQTNKKSTFLDRLFQAVKWKYFTTILCVGFLFMFTYFFFKLEPWMERWMNEILASRHLFYCNKFRILVLSLL